MFMNNLCAQSKCKVTIPSLLLTNAKNIAAVYRCGELSDSHVTTK